MRVHYIRNITVGRSVHCTDLEAAVPIHYSVNAALELCNEAAHVHDEYDSVLTLRH